MGQDDVEELKKQFITDETLYEAERLKDDLKTLIKFCKITAQGKVLLLKKDLSDKKKVGLVIIARYIGKRLDDNVADIITADEIAEYTNIEKTIVNARLTELVDEGFANRPETGKYKANPTLIKDFLEDIEKTK